MHGPVRQSRGRWRPGCLPHYGRRQSVQYPKSRSAIRQRSQSSEDQSKLQPVLSFRTDWCSWITKLIWFSYSNDLWRWRASHPIKYVGCLTLMSVLWLSCSVLKHFVLSSHLPDCLSMHGQNFEQQIDKQSNV